MPKKKKGKMGRPVKHGGCSLEVKYANKNIMVVLMDEKK